MTRLGRTLRSIQNPSMDDLARVLLAGLVFLLPLIATSLTADSFILPKECVFWIGAAGIGFLCVLQASRGVLNKSISAMPFRLLLEPLNAAAVAFFAWMAISILWSASPALAREEVFRHGMLLAFFLCAQSLLAHSRRRMVGVAAAFLASTLIVASWTIIQDFRAAFFSDTLAVRAVLGDWRDALSLVALGNTSHLGDVLALGTIGWSAALILSRARIAKVLCVAALWLHAAALIVAWSVHSNASLIIGAAVMIWLLRHQLDWRRLLRRRSTLAVFAGWIFVVAFYVVDQPLNPHGSRVWGATAPGAHGGIFAQAFSSERWKDGWPTREAIWLTTLEMVRQTPWFGHGAGNFTYVYPGTVSKILIANPDLSRYAGAWTNAAHNEVLQFWSELGIVGVALLVLLIALSMRVSIQRLRAGPSFGTAVILAAGMACLVAQCVQSQMNFPLQLPVSLMQFYLLLALPIILPKSAAEEYVMNVPIEREMGPLLLGVTMKNMAYPSELNLRARGNVAKMGVILCAALLAALAIRPAIERLRGDREYRLFRDAAGFGPSGEQLARAERVLEIWPGHVDCRSAYQDLLLRMKRYEDVLTQTPIVLERLNASEVYGRRAEALIALGREAEAAPDIKEMKRRRGE
ncbi:hypothetical protein BH09SUM1_BH09SUM1_07500 [soil metagenome]